MSTSSHEKGETPPPEGLPDRVLEHEYDGIREFDNPMPRWWLLTFAGTVIFSGVYLLNIGPVGNGRGRIADYQAEVAENARLHPPTLTVVTDEGLRELAKDPSVLAAGQKVFSTMCVACHGANGGGIIGPNLTDEFWLHGSHPSEIHHTIVEGVLDKGMPPWGKVLKPEQVNAVVVYIASLQGSHPANAKEPQGELSKP